MSASNGLPPLDIIGTSPEVVEAVALAHRAARTSIPVLIVGETGTGKELLARHVHYTSRRTGALVAVDCGTLPDELVESLLFGHRRGAFTGAFEQSSGLIADAEHGTLFMDELSSLSLRGQSKLLRVLETGIVRRVGDSRGRLIGFRLVATAQPGLWNMTREGTFREDLMQRAAGVVIRLPSLRDRGNDLGLLARHFAASEGVEIEDRAVAMLAQWHWPGNVRELRWVIVRSALVARNRRIDEAAINAALEIGPVQLPLGQAPPPSPEDTTWILVLCEMHRGDAAEVARAMGIGRSTLYRRLKKAGIRIESFRRRAEGE